MQHFYLIAPKLLILMVYKLNEFIKNKVKGRIVVDIGCGRGLNYLINYGKVYYIGIDLDVGKLRQV